MATRRIAMHNGPIFDPGNFDIPTFMSAAHLQFVNEGNTPFGLILLADDAGTALADQAGNRSFVLPAGLATDAEDQLQRIFVGRGIGVRMERIAGFTNSMGGWTLSLNG